MTKARLFPRYRNNQKYFFEPVTDVWMRKARTRLQSSEGDASLKTLGSYKAVGAVALSAVFGTVGNDLC